jgi:hypothetical protein
VAAVGGRAVKDFDFHPFAIPPTPDTDHRTRHGDTTIPPGSFHFHPTAVIHNSEP